MTATRRRDRPLIRVLYPVTSASVGLVILCLPALALGNALAGSPLDAVSLALLVGTVTVVGTVGLFVGVGSIDRLWDYVLVLVASVVGFGLVGSAVVALVGLDVSGVDPRPQAILWGSAHLNAYLLVYRADVRI